MKKFIFFLCMFLIGIGNVFASDRINVKLADCVDGDTAKFVLNDEIIKARFLAIDTPESVHPKKEVEPYGKEASKFTCDTLKNANTIEIEYDENSDKYDKYNRHLVWVFVDNELLQDTLVEQGLAKVAYLYGDYKYTDVLKSAELEAKTNNLNIWSNNTVEKADYKSLIIGVCCVILLLILYKNKIITKSQLKKQLKKIG